MIRQNKNKLKRPLALLLVCVLLAGVAIPAHALLTETPDASGSPTVRVISTLTDGGQYLEVGLNIDSKEDGKFQSVGALLKYDPDMLTPVQWDEPATEINVPVSSEAAKTWSEAELLPAKGADELNGKVAAAAKSEASGFLYLSAESARVKNGFMQPLPTEAGDKTTLPTLSETTTQGLPISAIAKAETPSQQAVVVRFKVNEKPPAEAGGDITEAAPQPELYSLAELAAALDIVDPTADEATTLSFPLADKSGLTYIADNTSVSSAGQTTPANLEFLWVQEGVTVNSGTGGGSTEGIIAVTAFDWDGTMLGSFIFAADADPDKQLENAQEALDAFVAQEDIAAVLQSHAGYDFLTWVKNEDKIPSSYGTRVSSSSNTTLETLEIADEDILDFSTLTQSTTMKAAYTTNEECILGDGLSSADARDARRYITSIVSYDRFGTGNSFSIRIKIERGNVPRVTNGALRVRMNIDGVDIFSQYDLVGADSEIVEVAPFAQSAANGTLKGAEIVEWTVIDTYGISNWVGAAERTKLEECRSKASFSVKSVGSANNIAVWDEGTYPFYGVAAGINNALEEYHNIKITSDNPASVTPTNNNMAGVSVPILRSIGIPTRAIGAMRIELYNEWIESGMTDLDYQAIYEAASGTLLHNVN